MNKRVIALVLAAALLCSPCTAYAAESSSAPPAADSGVSVMDSGMKDPGYYSAAYAEYLAKLDSANAAKGIQTKLWMAYMIKWGKAIPYRPTPDNYVYQPRNPKARAATIPISSLPMGTKMVDLNTAWYGEPLIWIKISNDVLQPNRITDEKASQPHYYSGDGNWDKYTLRYEVNTTKQLWVTEQSISRLPLDGQYRSLYYPNRSLRGWLTTSAEDSIYKIFGFSFLDAVISPNLKKYMVPSALSESLTNRQYWKNKSYDMYFDWVSLPPSSGEYGVGYNGWAGDGYRFPYFANNCCSKTKRTKTHKVYVSSEHIGQVDPDWCGVDFPNRILTSRTSNSTDYYYAEILGTDGEIPFEDYDICNKRPNYNRIPSGEIRPTIALKEDTQVYSVPDANGVYTLIGSLVTPAITQSYNAGTNKSTITASAVGAASMKITYGGAVVATANGSSITYAAAKNGSYTVTGSNGSASLSAAVNVTAIDDAAPVITNTAPAGGWAGSKTTTITLTDAKTPGGMQYNIGGGWLNYSAPFTHKFTANGSISVMARDKWGCTSGTKTISASQIDTTAPTAPSIAKSPTSAWHKDNVTVTINGGSDAGSGINRYQYNIGGGAWQNYSAPFAVASSAAVNARTVDNVGLVSGGSNISVNIDRITPTGSITYNKAWTKSNVELRFAAADFGGSNVARVRAGSGGWVAGAAAAQTVSANGSYGFTVEDNAGNSQTVTEKVTCIDKILPVVSEINFVKTSDDLSGLRTLFNKQLEINIAASDSASGIHTVEYQLVEKGEAVNNGAWLPYSAAIKPRVTKRFDGAVAARCTDTAGNISAVVQLDVTAEDTPPTAAHTLSMTEWTNSAVNIHVEARDDLSGVASITLPSGVVVQGETAHYSVSINDTYRFVVTDKCGNVLNYDVVVGNIDLTPPTVSYTLSPPTWTNEPVKISIAAEDEASGVAGITLPDGSVVRGGSANYIVTQNGSCSFAVTDNAGNVYNYTVAVDKLDYIAPIVTGVELTATDLPLLHTMLRAFSPSNFRTQVRVGVSCTDEASGVASTEYQLVEQGGSVDESAWQLYSDADKPIIQRHFVGQVAARCTDAAGTSSAVFYEDVIVEDVPPTAEHTLSTKDWINKPVTISLSTADDAAGVASITLPSGEVVQSESADYIVNSNGTYRFVVTDKCGNVLNYDVLVGNIDLTPPTAAHKLSPPTWTNKPVKISIAAEDDASGVASITLPGGSIVRGGSADYIVTQNGSCSFVVTDNAGNIYNHDVTVDNIDYIAPSITGFALRGVGESPVKSFMRGVFPYFFTEQVEILVTAEDDYSGIETTEYQVMPRGAVLDSGGWEVYGSEKPPRLEKEMDAAVAVRTTDKAGNVSAVLTKDVVIDGSAPAGSHTLSTTEWTKHNVTITVKAADKWTAASYITLPDGTLVEGDNADYVVTQNGDYPFILADELGNSCVYTVPIRNIDKQSPGITGFALRGVGESPVKAFMRGVFPSFFTEQVELLVTAEDDYSGIETTEYQITPRNAEPEGESWRVYDSGKPPRLEKEMDAAVAVRTTDRAGNVSAVLTKDVIIDGSAPAGSHTLSTTEWCNTFVIITVKAVDKWTAASYITLPDGTVTEGGTASFRVVRNGDYPFILADELGNSCVYTVPVTNIEEVYPTPPKLGIEDGTEPTDDLYVPDNLELGWENSTIDVKSLAQSGIEKYQYTSTLREPPAQPIEPMARRARSVTAENWIDCGSEIAVKAAGIWDVRVRAISYAGNVSGISSYVLKNDYTPPTGTAEVNSREIKFTASDDLSGVKSIACMHDNAEIITLGGELTCQMSQTETHIYTVTDNAGLTAEIPVEYIRPSDEANVGGSEVPGDKIFVEGDKPEQSIPLPEPSAPQEDSKTAKDNTAAQEDKATDDKAGGTTVKPPNKGGASELDSGTGSNSGNIFSRLWGALKGLLNKIRELLQKLWAWFMSLPPALRVIIALSWLLLILLICYYIYRRVKKAAADRRGG